MFKPTKKIPVDSAYLTAPEYVGPYYEKSLVKGKMAGVSLYLEPQGLYWESKNSSGILNNWTNVILADHGEETNN